MKTRTGHPQRAGKQQELREKLYDVFEWIDTSGDNRAMLIAELRECVSNEVDSQGFGSLAGYSTGPHKASD